MGPTPATATLDFEESLTAPQPTPVPSWQGQGKGMEGGGGRRVVEAYHHQLQVSGVVKSLHSVFRCGVCGHEGHDTARCLRVSKPVV